MRMNVKNCNEAVIGSYRKLLFIELKHEFRYI